MNAVVVFDIVGDEDERFSTILHRWVLRLQPAASPILVHIPLPFADTTTTPPPKVTYNVKITCSDSTFLSLVRGKTSPEFAFMRGLLKVKGQVATAMKLKTVWSQFNV